PFDVWNLRPVATHGCRGIFESAALLFFAYTGYARVATLGEEVRDPKRTIPRAVKTSLTIATLLYIAASLTTVGAIGANRMAHSISPLVEAAKGFSLWRSSLFTCI